MKPQFSAAVLATVLLSSFALSAVADSSRRDLHKNLKFDLNGDGRLDTIVLKVNKKDKDDSKFQLTINGATLSGKLGDTVRGFYIANIDRADKFCEVVVYTPGPSDDDEHLIYWYDGKRIHRLAHLSIYVNYRGDGTLSVTSHEGFWEPHDEWFLTRSHELRHKPRAFYPVNVKATTIKATPLHTSIDSKKVLLTPAKRAAFIVKSNPTLKWYYVKVGNKAGWLTETELYAHLSGMPFAD